MDTAQSIAVGTMAYAPTEGARRATGVGACAEGKTEVKATCPDPEVREKQKYRRMTVEYKLRILREADACGSGGIGALLRREGLYSSHLTRWRKQRDCGVLSAMILRKRGRKEDADRPLRKKLAAQEREIERLKKRLKQAETIIDVQKKVSEMLGVDLNLGESDGRNE